jgi:hypothetical protein
MAKVQEETINGFSIIITHADGSEIFAANEGPGSGPYFSMCRRGAHEHWLGLTGHLKRSTSFRVVPVVLTITESR